mmetsp:Transcript_76703/g.206820  ORF Transcript_76703/g.206820 Transcript_76703/m.206820 type:complete len:238 (-) Transcript_76703:519-1232(-)
MSRQDASLGLVQWDDKPIPKPSLHNLGAHAQLENSERLPCAIRKPWTSGSATMLGDLALLRYHHRHTTASQHTQCLDAGSQFVIAGPEKRRVRPQGESRLDDAGQLSGVLPKLLVGAQEPRAVSHPLADLGLLDWSEQGAIWHLSTFCALLVHSPEVDVHDHETFELWQALQHDAPIVRLCEGGGVPIQEAMHRQLGLEVQVHQRDRGHQAEGHGRPVVHCDRTPPKTVSPNLVIKV